MLIPYTQCRHFTPGNISLATKARMYVRILYKSQDDMIDSHEIIKIILTYLRYKSYSNIKSEIRIVE